MGYEWWIFTVTYWEHIFKHRKICGKPRSSCSENDLLLKERGLYTFVGLQEGKFRGVGQKQPGGFQMFQLYMF